MRRRYAVRGFQNLEHGGTLRVTFAERRSADYARWRRRTIDQRRRERPPRGSRARDASAANVHRPQRRGAYLVADGHAGNIGNGGRKVTSTGYCPCFQTYCRGFAKPNIDLSANTDVVALFNDPSFRNAAQPLRLPACDPKMFDLFGANGAGPTDRPGLVCNSTVLQRLRGLSMPSLCLGRCPGPLAVLSSDDSSRRDAVERPSESCEAVAARSVPRNRRQRLTRHIRCVSARQQR